MKRILILIALVAAGCSPQGGPNTAEGDPGGMRALPVDPSVVSARYEEWPYREQAQADLDADGQPETVVLASDVTMGENGQPIWEDGHRWVLWVAEAGGPQPMYGAFVPRGRAEAAVGLADESGARPLLIIERSPERVKVVEISYADGTGSVLSEGNWFPGEWLVRP